MGDKYIAHTREDGEEQTLFEHCTETAKLCAQYAKEFNAENLGYITGLLHDIGKYSDEFQAYIRKNGSSVDHSTAGSKEAINTRKEFAQVAAYCIAGHHAGLKNDLPERYKKNICDYKAYLKEIDITQALLTKSSEECVEYIKKSNFSGHFLVRMLFSCLVDADFLDTEKFMRIDEYSRSMQSLESISGKLELQLSKFKNIDYEKMEASRRKIMQCRNAILQDCLCNAEQKTGIYSLTVPTGGGKTWDTMAFAIRHAKAHGKKRIIYVIPYTSIIEQTADVFRKVFGEENVLEHHSNVNYQPGESEITDKMLLATENWDAPIIVTTNVQFFESLFANKSSRCRKIHNIANSVVIFDEAQMLPMGYLKICMQAIAELVKNCNTTAVLCTATQPAIKKYLPNGMEVKEIVNGTEEYYKIFQRVTFEMIEKTDEEQLQQKINENKQALCIVNTRKRAKQLYELCEAKSKYCLTTLQNPKNRREILKEIREKLEKGEECIVFSTTVIEAGVDVDFPCVFREMSGLDSILQAAGRCNREGKRSKSESIVYIFGLGKLPKYVEWRAEMFRLTKEKFADFTSPQAIQYYFEKLYSIDEEKLDEKQMVSKHNSPKIDFEEIAKEFRLIDNDMVSIVICDESNEEIGEIIERIRYGEISRTMMRKLTPYIINIYPQHLEQLIDVGAAEMLNKELAILTDIENYYDKCVGLQLDIEGGVGIFV